MIEMVFMPTLNMIRSETALFPEHRVNFFQMVDSATRSCFEVVINLPEKVLSMIIQSLLWALQHTIRQVAEIGIIMVRDILERVREVGSEEVRQRFYQQHYMNMLNHVMGVVTDHNQVPFVGLGNLSEAVCQLFQTAETDIKIELSPGRSNLEYVADEMGNVLATHFANLNA